MSGSLVLHRPVLLAALALLAAPAAAVGGLVPEALLALPAPALCQDLCPDLTVDRDRMKPFLTTINYPSTDCVVVEGMAPPGLHRVVRFATSLPNVGLADLVMGNPADEPEQFVWSDCHRHYHVVEYAEYRVWQPDDYQQYQLLRLTNPAAPADDVLAQLPADAKPVQGNKHARCVIDLLEFLPLVAEGAKYRSCFFQGISVGWADHYNANVQGQWVVVDGLAPGQYLMEIEVNAGRLYRELEYWNNSVTAPFTIT